MLPCAAKMTNGRRKRNPYYQVDQAWKTAVRALMDRRKISQADLARKIGASPASLVRLFKPETIQSGLVPAIHRVLSLDPPLATTISERDDAKRRLDRIWNELSEEERNLLLSVAARFRDPTH